MTDPTADARTVLQRVVFPVHGDPQALPLYLDAETWSWTESSDGGLTLLAKARGLDAENPNRRPLRLTSRNDITLLDGRRGLTVPAGRTISLGTYFNGFPASYWNTWTALDGVVLRVRTNGVGRVIVYRSNARGVVQRVDAVEVAGEATTEFDLPFTSFIDGGWLWFDLIADDADFSLVEGDWLAREGASPRTAGTATVSITTLNRGDYCTRLLTEIGNDEPTIALLDRVLVVDQGSERIVENAGYPAAQAVLGDRLQVIEQANLGGSGGFSRGMLETVRAGDSEYVLLLDDDVEVEPESIRRAITFGNFCNRPTIVGGHMLDMYDKSKLHAYAEGIRWDAFIWGPFTPDRHDFAESNLRQTRWMHRRFDVDYNGWWMSLIPVEVVRSIGLSLPVFIKWDDAEYSLRARAHGAATVSLPGAAVWHVSWVDKDDSHDWQAFFHARNRLVAALLHSPKRRGGKLWRSNLASDVKNLLTMDYYTVAMKHEAIRNVLRGPGQLHTDMVDRLARVRALGADFVESKPMRIAEELPRFPAREIKTITTSTVDPGPTGLAFVGWLTGKLWRHAFAKPVGTDSPRAHLAYQDARWFQVPEYDSVLVTNAEGSAVTWHVRNPRRFRRMLVDAVRLNLRYRRAWPRLSRQYRDALPEITSIDRWADSLGVDGRGSDES
ncbi:glycosyltransferase [Agromyces intestinalis]|uniref:Glycosyltransferase n=1 Tax=Agromyces intestinalis TaxID=2592652 RepID=A0A5C1YDB8_9MICO|nr:glycosyltransferase [Agromyces intestinalis]QEO13540.1 glycosyltransferase [Agromyces intestinalis]